jgi:hypothetical protein
MSETPQLQVLLGRLEEEFHAALVPVLQEAERGHDAWLFVRETTAIKFGLGSRHSEQAEVLATKAEKIEVLREDLGIVDPSCAATRYLQACLEAADLDDNDQLGPQRTAQNMLRDLRTGRL